MRKLILLSVIQIAILSCQVFIYRGPVEQNNSWINNVEIDIEVSKNKIYTGENFVLYMIISNKSNESQLIPFGEIQPNLNCFDINIIKPDFFLKDNSYLILVPGEKVALSYTGTNFFSTYYIETKLRGFPAGKYQFYSVFDKDNLIEFTVNEYVDPKSIELIKRINSYDFMKNEEFPVNEIYALDNPISRRIAMNKYKYKVLCNRIKEENVNKDEVLAFIKEFQAYGEAKNLILFIQRKSSMNKNLDFMDDKFVNDLQNKGLKSFITWSKFKNDQADYIKNEKLKIFKADN